MTIFRLMKIKIMINSIDKLIEQEGSRLSHRNKEKSNCSCSPSFEEFRGCALGSSNTIGLNKELVWDEDPGFLDFFPERTVASL